MGFINLLISILQVGSLSFYATCVVLRQVIACVQMGMFGYRERAGKVIGNLEFSIFILLVFCK